MTQEEFLAWYRDVFHEKVSDWGQIQQAVAKMVPMKVKDIHVDEYYCPNCYAENNCDEGTVGDVYCPACGQRLEQKGAEEPW